MENDKNTQENNHQRYQKYDHMKGKSRKNDQGIGDTVSIIPTTVSIIPKRIFMIYCTRFHWASRDGCSGSCLEVLLSHNPLLYLFWYLFDQHN